MWFFNPPRLALQFVDDVPRKTNGIAAPALDDRNGPFTPGKLEVILPTILPDRLRPELFVGKYRRATTLGMKNLKALADGGVKYGIGTDTGVPGRFQGYFEHMELEQMVQAGLTPMQVLVAATRSGAEFLNAKDLGTLQTGKWADLIVLSRNPLDDIKNTKSITDVYIAGNKVH